jgi:hypothetical protein
MRKPLRVIVAGCLLGGLVLVLIPTGHHDAYPQEALADTEHIQACQVLTTAAITRVTDQRVSAQFVLLPWSSTVVENLFPSISRAECEYRLSKPCSGTPLRSVNLFIVDEPTHSQALYRYTYNAMLLGQDSTVTNDYVTTPVDGYTSYRLAIGNEVLVRILDNRFILDLQGHFCSALPASREEAFVSAFLAAIEFPVSNDLAHTAPLSPEA